MTGRHKAGAALVGALLLLPLAASAQTPGPARVSLGGGAGVAIPFHGDFDFTPWAWEADVRVAMSRHAVVEGAVGEWRHTRTFAMDNIQVTPGPGVIGRLTETTTRRQRTLQVNVLFTGARARLRMTAGGGAGLLQHHRRTDQVTTGCSPGVSCGSFESTFSNISGAAQGVGGAEVRAADGLAVYGQMRFVVPFRDPGGSDLRLTAGLRWGLGG